MSSLLFPGSIESSVCSADSSRDLYVKALANTEACMEPKESYKQEKGLSDKSPDNCG